jgi:hypothetical protein
MNEAPFSLGEVVFFLPERRHVEVTNIFKSDIAPSGWIVSADGNGPQGVFAKGKRRTGAMCSKNFERSYSE